MRRLSGLAILLASALSFGFQDALAQGEDALPLRRGTLRINLLPDWARWNERFGRGTPGFSDGSREPLAVDFSSDTLGVARIPSLAATEQRLAFVTGLTGFALNLGRARLTLNNSVRVIPIGIDLALSSRLVVRASLPVVRARVETYLLGADSTAATRGNVGLNPALVAPATYDAYLQQVDTLLRALTQQSQTGPAALRAQATAELQNILPLLCGLYILAAGNPQGNACTAPGAQTWASPVLPIDTSAAGDSLLAHLGAARASYESLRAQYAAQGVAMPAFDAAYALPGDALDSTGLRNTILGFGGDSLTGIVRTRIGNVEVGGWYQLAMGSRWRSLVAFTLRLPTATEDSPHYFADLGTGTEAMGYEVAFRNDVVLRRDFWVHAGIRMSGWSSYDLVRRIGPPTVLLLPIGDTATVRRTPGQTVVIDVVPNWQLDDAFRLGMGVHWIRLGGTTHAYVNAADATRIGLAASVLDQETAMTALRLGAGITFSTLGRYAAGRASLPYTVTASYNRVFSGSGGNVPAASSFSLLLRGYIALWR
jgi:hypothetical protein